MRNAPALARLIAPMIAAGILVGGCAQTPPARTADAGASTVYGLTGPGGPAAGGAPPPPGGGGATGPPPHTQGAPPGTRPAGRR